VLYCAKVIFVPETLYIIFMKLSGKNSLALNTYLIKRETMYVYHPFFRNII